jgi:hypothetical protein
MDDARSLVSRLRSADASLRTQRLAPRAVRRIRHRMVRELARSSTHARGWFPMATFVAGAMLVLAVLAFGRRSEPVDQQRSPSLVTTTTPRPHGADCRWNDRAGLRMEGACEVDLETPPVRIHTLAGSRLTIVDHRAQLEEGGALFEVSPIRGTPFVVGVPNGTITVVGTRFRVVVEEHGGHIELFEGIVDFAPTSGDSVRLQPGQRHDFGDPRIVDEASSDPPTQVHSPQTRPEPRPAPTLRRAPASASATRPSTAPPSATDLIDEVTALRARGEYDTAARRLESALASPGWDRRAAEVLSFELGTILTRHIGDVQRACRHWNEHLDRFTSPRYRDAITRHRTRLECPTR